MRYRDAGARIRDTGLVMIGSIRYRPPAQTVARLAVARLAVGLWAVAAGLLAGGCTGSPGPAPVPAGTGTATGTTTATGTAGPGPGLFAVESRTLGAIVIDAQGYVLYRFDSDSARPSRSTCLAACTELWRPAPAGTGLRGVGIDRQLVGTLTRPDGTEQLTLAGWPLYGYLGDRLPGDTNGQGQDDHWYVIAPTGAKAGQAGAPAG